MKMQLETLSGVMLAVQVLILAMRVTPLHSASPTIETVEQVVISASMLQESSAVHQLSLSPDLSIQSIYALGSTYFSVNASHMVYSTGTVPVGRYALTIVIEVEDATSLSYCYLTINVTPEASQACELQLFGTCSQFCALDASTYDYSCFCAEGYILQQDNVTCLAFEPLPSLLVATNDGLTQLNLLTKQHTPLSLSGTVHHFDYLYADQTIFYADNSRQVISSVAVDGSGEEVFWSYGLQMVSGLVVDWVDRRVLYSTDDAIVAVDIKTRQNTTVHSGLNQPRRLVVNASIEQTLLFWVEGENELFVTRRSSLNGSSPDNVTTSSVGVLDLSVDSVSQTLYWVTAEGSVCSSSFGGDNTVCFQCCNGAAPSAITVFEVFIYLSLSASNSVVQIRKDPENHTPVVYKEITHPIELVIAHPLIQPGSVQGISSCDQCEQLCVVGMDSVSCDCSPGYRLSPNGVSCHIDEISDLVLAQSVPSSTSLNSVIRVSLTGRETDRLVDTSFGPLLSPKTGLVYAMDYDRQSNAVFYGDRNSSTLWRASLNRQHSAQDDRELLVSGAHAWDMAFDWIDRTIYWSDDRNGTINSVSLSTSGVATVTTIVTGQSQPRGLDVDPLNRQLYWVESGTNSIWRYSLDNLLLEVFASSLDDPSGLVIDHQSKLLYWTELSGNIRRISLDGSGQELIYNNSATFPFKIALYRDYVLWIDGGSGADSISVLHRERLEESGSISVVPPGSRTLTSLLVVGSNRQMTRGQYECVQNIAGCSHYCQTEDDANVCFCPPGYNLLSGTTCNFEGECPVCSGDCVVQGPELTCSCPPGFRGNACDQSCEEGTFGDSCAQMCTCLNGGGCDSVNGSCTCTEGYEGTNCGQAICSNGCQNGGTCVEPNTCFCAPSYGGTTCERRVCPSDFCLNGGTCNEDFGLELSCSCPSHTSGIQCQFIDDIFFPATGSRVMLSMSVGIPIGLFVLVLVAVIVIAGVYYYLRCVPHRKTNPLEGQDDIPPPKDISSPEHEASAGTAGNPGGTAHTKTELNGNESQDSEHHIYVQR